MNKDPEILDVIVVGAGISGISAGYHLQKMCAGKTFAILEARDRIGGTWDLFRYPGIRSDSDMFTLGFAFRPWPNAKSIADGPSIRRYVTDTAREYGLTEKIRFNHRVKKFDWSSKDALWAITVEHDGDECLIHARFIISASGYYRYSGGYTPDFPGIEDFSGTVIHPQQWPEDLDYTNKKIVVIGSGATAVTLVPALAEKAAHVTMLQRSPSYYFSMPGTSKFANFLRKILPAKMAHTLVRWQRVFLQQVSFKYIRANPKSSARNLIKVAKNNLPEGYDTKTHFTPSYNPWEQRLCVVPDADLFEAISSGSASVETDTIERFTPKGILLSSGKHLETDIVVTATGLTLESFGGADIFLEGEKVNPGDLLSYKGALFETIPNFISIFGYTNASWTLRADLENAYACRLINYLDEQGFAAVTPVNSDPDMDRDPFLDFSSGYVTRAIDMLPKQGERDPWRSPQDYFHDMRELKYGKIENEALVFTKKGELATPKPSLHMKIAAE